MFSSMMTRTTPVLIPMRQRYDFIKLNHCKGGRSSITDRYSYYLNICLSRLYCPEYKAIVGTFITLPIWRIHRPNIFMASVLIISQDNRVDRRAMLSATTENFVTATIAGKDFVYRYRLLFLVAPKIVLAMVIQASQFQQSGRALDGDISAMLVKRIPLRHRIAQMGCGFFG